MWIVAVLLIFGLLTLISLAVFNPYISIFGTIYLHGKQGTKQIALTFDDGPNPKATGKILDILRRHQVVATFFVLGINAERYPNLIRRMHQEGHEVGIHGFDHNPRFLFWSQKKQCEDVEKTIVIIQKITGQRPTLFRCPFGRKTPWLLYVVRSLGLMTVHWSQDSHDWYKKPPAAAKMVQSLDNRVRGGDIIIMHDGRDVQQIERPETVAAVPVLIASLQAKGFVFVTVDKLLELQ